MQTLLDLATYRARLTKACDTLGLHASDTQIQQLQHYIEQLNRWNKSYNLTAIRDPEQMLTQHIFDCLAIVTPIKNAIESTKDSGATLLDVGSGAGLPGIVLAIMLPAVQVTCIDAVEKKMAFVRQMKGVLGLPNLTALHARIETLADQYDMVVSRAFASLSDFAKSSGDRVLPRGKLVAMKARPAEQEFSELTSNTTWSVDKIEALHVPELQAQRCLVWLQRSENP